MSDHNPPAPGPGPAPHDLTTEAGLVAWISAEVMPAARGAYRGQNELHTFGVVVATRYNGASETEPQLRGVAACDHEPHARQRIRSAAVELAALGVVVVQACDLEKRVGKFAVIALDHRRFGVRAWAAPVRLGEVGEFEPLATDVRVEGGTTIANKMRYLPGRTMN